MFRNLYAEDPSPAPVPEHHTRQTLARFRSEPIRGIAVVLELDHTIAGYSFLVSFWSNELGGEIIVIDELYVRPAHRNQGHARTLITALSRENNLWPGRIVAVELETTPQNRRASALYTRLGFRPVKNTRLRLLR